MYNNRTTRYSGINTWRVVREVKRTAAKFGFQGDALNPNCRLGYGYQEDAIREILWQMDGRIRVLNNRLATHVARNIVMNSRRVAA